MNIKCKGIAYQLAAGRWRGVIRLALGDPRNKLRRICPSPRPWNGKLLVPRQPHDRPPELALARNSL
jgi:hypothetical protein